MEGSGLSANGVDAGMRWYCYGENAVIDFETPTGADTSFIFWDYGSEVPKIATKPRRIYALNQCCVSAHLHVSC